MALQRFLLRAMLWMLGLAAAAGVLAVFLSTGIMGRVAGTALIAAFAIGIAMPISRLLDDDAKRLGGLVGLMSIVAAFIAALGAMWVDTVTSTWIDIEWRLAATAMIVLFGGVIAGVLLASRGLPWARWTVRIALVTDIIVAGLLLISAWMDTNGEPAASAGFMLASGVAASLALIGVGIDHRPWRWVGVLAGAVALWLGISEAWNMTSYEVTSYLISMCVAAVIAHAIAVLRVPLGDARFWVLFASIGSTAATGVCVSMLAIITSGFDESPPDMLVRLSGALGIISACSTLAVVVVYRLHRRPPGTMAMTTNVASIQLVCPHCARRIDAHVGENVCEGCGLVITLTVREPYCTTCEYPLLGLKGPVCPECGTPR